MALTREQIDRVLWLRGEGRTFREIGLDLGVHHTTVMRACNRYKAQAAKGFPNPELDDVKSGPPPVQELNQVYDKTDMDGTVDVLRADRILTPRELMAACDLDPKMWIPKYFRPNTWEGFYKLKDGNDHRKVRLFQSRAVFQRVMAEEIQEAILAWAREVIRPAAPRKSRKGKTVEDPYVLAWGLWDAHIGMYAWQSEVGYDFDIGIAVQRIKNSVDDMIEELKPYNIQTIWMPIGNDYMHFDSVRLKTAFGEHYLDTDTRYAKVYNAALHCLCYMVDRALEICDDVDLMYVPGNHDTTSSYTLCACLQQRYRKEDRVKVDLAANPRKWRRHGGTLVMFDHGQECKPDRYTDILSEEAREVWADTTYREVQIGHKHKNWEKMYESVIPTVGVLVRRNPCLCNTDVWHHNKGFISRPMKSVEAWRYDKIGYRGSHVVWTRDIDTSK